MAMQRMALNSATGWYEGVTADCAYLVSVSAALWEATRLHVMPQGESAAGPLAGYTLYSPEVWLARARKATGQEADAIRIIPRAIARDSGRASDEVIVPGSE